MVSLSGLCRITIWLTFVLVILATSALAQEATAPSEPAPVPVGPLPPPQEQLLSPVPQQFDWVSRDVRPNPLLESLLGLQETQSQLFMSVTLSEEYFDNFSQSGAQGDGTGGEEEFRTTLSLSTVYRLERGRSFVSLANSISGNYEARSENNNIGFANLSLNVGYEFPRLSLALSDSFIREDDTLQTSSSNIREGRRTFTRNSVTPQIRFALSRVTSTTLAYTNTVVVNEGAEQTTSLSHAVTTGLQHRFSRRLSSNLSYSFTARDDGESSGTAQDNGESSTSQTHSAAADIGYILTRRTNLSVQTFGALITRSGGGGTDSQNYGLSIGVNHQLASSIGLFVTTGATVTKRQGQGLRADPNWQASLNAALSPRTNLTLSTQGSVSDTGGQVDNVGLVLRQSVSVDLGQTVSRALRLALFATFTRTEFLENAGTDESDLGRDDNFWNAGATASYALTRVWSLSLAYRYQRRDSNRAEDDFDANRVTLAVSGRFSVL